MSWTKADDHAVADYALSRRNNVTLKHQVDLCLFSLFKYLQQTERESSFLDAARSFANS